MTAIINAKFSQLCCLIFPLDAPPIQLSTRVIVIVVCSSNPNDDSVIYIHRRKAHGDDGQTLSRLVSSIDRSQPSIEHYHSSRDRFSSYRERSVALRVIVTVLGSDWSRVSFLR